MFTLTTYVMSCYEYNQVCAKYTKCKTNKWLLKRVGGGWARET